MKDLHGEEIIKGDRVLLIWDAKKSTKSVSRGTVTGFSDKTVVIKDDYREKECFKKPENIIVLLEGGKNE